MIISLDLSSEEIRDAVTQLRMVEENLREGISELIRTLTVEGAEIAQSAYGEWGVEAIPECDETMGEITVVGDYPLIAEFGAGDTTADPLSMFENAPVTPVYSGSYSLLEGSQEYYKTGKWHFGGTEYTYVYPRRGLHQAKEFIVNNSTDVAREVIKLD